MTRLDELTGIPSTRALNDFFATVEVASGACWLAVVDVDTLLFVNEGLGQATGDRYLAAIAQVLSASDDVFPYRIGGDEFALIAIGMSLPCFIAELQAMQEEVFRQNHPMPGHPVRKRCTVSIVVGTRPLGEVSDKPAFLQQLHRHLNETKWDGQQRYYQVFCEYGAG